MTTERPQGERRSGVDRRTGADRRDSKETDARAPDRSDRRTGSERRKQDRRRGVVTGGKPSREKRK